MMECELCKREMERLTVHHLVPRQATKRSKKTDSGPTANICSACHRQIHALFENKVLAKELNTVEKLQNEPQMRKFLSWICKQKGDKRIKVYRQK